MPLNGREEASPAKYISKFDNIQGSARQKSRYIVSVTNHKRELFYGLIRIHVLLHAAHEPIFGLAMMEELAHHGYRIGPGTLYPLLHGLERAGFLKTLSGRGGGRTRRLYAITASGRRALDSAKTKIDELHRELHEVHPRKMGKESRRNV